MPTATSNVRISRQAEGVLRELSERLNCPKSKVVEKALCRLEEALFWQEVHDFYARGEPEELRREGEQWDSTVGDGIPPGEW